MAGLSVTSNYNGEVLDHILTNMVLGNQAVEKGSVYIIDGVSDKIHIGKMVASTRPITNRQAMPTEASGTVTWSENYLQPQEMMVYIPDINPRLFERAWRQFQPTGRLVDRVLAPEIQRVFADVVMKQIQNQIGELIWQGDTSIAKGDPDEHLRFFNGFITRAAASANNIDVPNIGAITSSNILAILEDIDEAIPDPLYENPDMIIHMNTGDFRKYQQAIRNLDFKGQGPADTVPAEYAGREIRHYSGLPANTILVAMSTTGVDSNLYAAVDAVDDPDNLVIERLRPEGELYFLKALFKMDANLALDNEAVLYQGSGS
jgi:hypothetical protein